MAFAARYPGRCATCNARIFPGDQVAFAARSNGTRGVRHVACAPTSNSYAPGAAPGGHSAPPPPSSHRPNGATTGSTFVEAPRTREDAEIAAILAVEDLIVFVASESPADAARLDSLWRKYQSVKALMVNAGATDAERSMARNRALALCVRLTDSLVNPNKVQVQP